MTNEEHEWDIEGELVFINNGLNHNKARKYRCKCGATKLDEKVITIA